DTTPIKPSAAQRKIDFRRRQLPIAVWILGAATVLAMLTVRVRSHEFLGLAQVMQYRVSAPVGGTIDSVIVREYDTIEAGDVVARLDEGLLQARIQTAI